MISNIIFFSSLSFYLITILQWYSYKIDRIIFHFSKPKWNLFYLVLPFIIFEILSSISSKILIFFSIGYLFFIYLWQKKLDKKLVFTSRVKIFFISLAIYFLIFLKFLNLFFLSVIFALLTSNLIEFLKFLKFKKEAIKKLNKINPTIIQISASFGKTSIKNFLYQILSNKFNCHKTPRSVNTLAGIIKDINENLSFDNEIYIVEAGARKKGDIKKITNLLNPNIVIVGEIGGAHLEYFKNLENTRLTKLEALNSKRLKKAFLHSTTKNKMDNFYDELVQNVNSDLNGLNFDLLIDDKIYPFSSKILGAFNAENLAVSILVANYLGVDIKDIIKSVKNIKGVEFRLEIVKNDGNKFIINDGFNGNLKGMISSYELISSFDGKKIVVTPGIIEGSKEDNEKLAKKIDEIFDIAIISSHINEDIFKKFINDKKLIILRDKMELNSVLKKVSSKKELILFSNDAPSYV